MKIPFVMLLLQGIPEQIAIVILAFSIANKSFKWREAVFLGITFALVAFLVRLLPITFGVHTVVLIGLLFFYLSFIKKIDLNTAIFTSLLSYLILIIVESLTITIMMNLFDISREYLLSNTFIRILITGPYLLLLYLTAFFLKKRRLDRKEKVHVL